MLKYFPSKIAIESLTTIPKIQPKIRASLANGYWIPSPRAARKVLSPTSPTAILKAITREFDS